MSTLLHLWWRCILNGLLMPGAHWLQSRLLPKHLEWSPYARCALVTESTVAETSWMVSLCQVHIGYRVDCCRNRRQISNEVDCHRYSQLCRWYGRLCCRFWRQIGNNLNATACRGRHCHQLGWLRRRHGRLCRKCVRGQSDTVDFVNFEQRQLCWIQLCSQCTGVKNAQIPKLSVQSPQVMTESGSISNKNLALFIDAGSLLVHSAVINKMNDDCKQQDPRPRSMNNSW